MKNMSGLDDADRELSQQMSRAYAMTPRDEPPAAIDAAILAQAQAAVRGAAGDGADARGSVPYQSDRRRFHWGPPMATAALLVLSASLVMWMEREQPEVLTVSGPVSQKSAKIREQPAVEPAPPQAGRAVKVDGFFAAGRQRADSVPAESGASDGPAIAESMTSPAPQLADSRRSANSEAPVVTAEAAVSPSAVPSVPSTPPSPLAPPAAPAAPSPFTPSTAPTAAIASAERAGSGIPPGSPQKLAQSQPARSAAAPPAAERRSLGAAEGVGNFADSRDATQHESPQAWLARIAELRKQGRIKEAEESLAEFRKRYPDYPIPAAGVESTNPPR